MRSFIFLFTFLFSFLSLTLSHPHAPGLRHHVISKNNDSNSICRNPFSFFDYSVKIRRDDDVPVCPAETPHASLFSRQSQTIDDYSCSETKPCGNGACCPKKTGYCNYGPDACGTNGISPNDVCWSNCNAHAECGQYADPPGKECPLNVCCSQYGFCGMTSDFCTKGENSTTGCQSNCDQPGSGASGGNVQSRIIGYYEAWAHNRTCQGMNFNDIPAGALTHLHFAFGYITPGDFNIAPMDTLSLDLFNDLTNVKKKNSGLKAIVALGGWTFNDNGTATQPVYSNMVSSAGNRAMFISNLFSFLREYAFDGVDFDWEYPGAPDRGGNPDDGKNFVQFLKELDDANNKQPTKYVVSFTVPTSYWYLRWFDLTAVNYVDWVNVMSYDLHGVWDSTDPIGSHILAHTNLTEIQQALDLFWRNKVPANKLNLGLGFYGRSFQLSDLSCYTPGCNFKGGAAPGGCTQNSGTLSYREIMQIVDQNKLKPYYDKTDAVKYITWNQDQWVSYDDADTFKQKIDFANNLGLGGLLIWSIDQDTDDLQALQAVLAPKKLNTFDSEADDASYWQDATVPDCYVTDCGGSCKAGFIKVTNQPCGSATPVFRHSSKADSLLCCPLDGAPDPKTCTWRGSAPSCNGHCHDDEVAVELNRWGSGDYCEDGNKAYCCEVPDAKENKCYWTGAGKKCNSGDTLFTFSGTFLETIADIADTFGGLFGDALGSALDAIDMDLEKRYCCPPDDAKKWQNCKWYGQPGSCFDNHCPIGHSVQLTDSPYGLGESCFPRLERTRVFCCDPTGGKSPFLPVPLENLFPKPPTGSNVDTKFELDVDDTWGSGSAKTSDNEPDDAAFNFVVLSSPEELQISLDKRDGSHWEVFNCNEAVSEEEQTVQMVCMDTSESSNCYKIGLGHGVPGTILEMPSGCGPGKYAVAKSMAPSKNQELPPHLRKRGNNPVVYDLTFDYDFKRVPRDLGDTQMRIDFSNEEHYWDNVVAAAASGKKKSKRSLLDFGGNHKRWLEEEFRDDYHFGGLSKEELHKRWFGSGVLDWLKGLLNPKISRQYTHNMDETFTAKIVDDQWSCGSGDTKFEGHILAQALTRVKVSTSFGFTLITKLSLPLDLSESYLSFTNNGEVTATFTVQALAKVSYTLPDKTIVTLPFPGASFRIPGIATIGPSVRVLGSLDASLALSATIETKVDIASWEVQQTLPDASSDYDPKEIDAPDYGDTGSFNGLQPPQFYAEVVAEGQVTAHLKPSVEFGVRFDDTWKVGAAAVSITADGWVRLTAAAGISTTGTCPFTYGIDLGADLYVTVEAPSAFGWAPKNFPLPGIESRSPVVGGTCPTLKDGSPSKRSIGGIDSLGMIESGSNFNSSQHQLAKRSGVWGPPFHIPLTSLFCPNPEISSNSTGTACESISGWEPSQLTLYGKRDFSSPHIRGFEKRDRTTKPPLDFCVGSAKQNVKSPTYDTSSTLLNIVPNALTYGYTNRAQCNDFGFGQLAAAQGGTALYNTEHVLEFQLLGMFFDSINGPAIYPNPNPGGQGMVNLCNYMKPFWSLLPQAQQPNIGGVTMNPIDWVGSVFPGSDNQYRSEFILLEAGVNTAKGGMWGKNDINSDTTMGTYEKNEPDKAVKNIKDVMTALKYLQDATVSQRLVLQKNRVGVMLNQMDTVYVPQVRKTSRNGAFANWQAVGLQNQWNTWIRGRADVVRGKAETYISTYIAQLQEGYATPTQRDNANKGGNDPAAVAARTLIGKIDAISAEWNNQARWNNPF